MIGIFIDGYSENNPWINTMNELIFTHARNIIHSGKKLQYELTEVIDGCLFLSIETIEGFIVICPDSKEILFAEEKAMDAMMYPVYLESKDDLDEIIYNLQDILDDL